MATLIAAWLAGWEPGLLAALLGVLGGIIATRAAHGSWTVEPAAGLWLALNVLAALLVGSLRSALIRAEHTVDPPTSGITTAREQREWFEVTLSSIGDAVIATDNVGVIWFINEQATLLTGWSQADAQGKPLQDVFRICSEKTGEPVESPVSRVLRENRIVGLANHTLLIRRDGTRIPIADSGAPIHGADGGIVGVVLVFRDATQQREAEQAQEANARHVRRVLDTLPTMVGVLTPDGVITEANGAALRIAALQPEDVVGKPFVEAYWWSDSPETQARLRDAITQGVQGHTTRCDLRMRTGDDTWITIDFTLAPMRDDEGNVTHLIPSALDISARKRIEDELRLSEERLRTAIINSRAILFSQDQDLRYTWIHNSARGLTTQDVLGKFDEDLIPDPDDAARIKNFKREVLESGIGARREIMVHRDGQEVYLDIAVEPLRNGEGRVSGIICAALDVSERKRQAILLADALTVADREQRQLRAVLTHLPVLVLIADGSGSLIEINNAAQTFFREGFPHVTNIAEYANFVGYWSDSGERVQKHKWPLSQAVLEGKTITSEMMDLVLDNGTRRTLLVSAAPIYDQNGAIIGGISVGTDITERRREAVERERLLAQIAHERDRLHTLIDSITDEIWFCDSEGNIELVNVAVRRQFGLSDEPESSLGKLTSFIAPLDISYADGHPRPPEESPLLRSLAGETIRDQVEIVRSPAVPEPTYRQVSSAPLQGEAGVITGAVAIVHDITEQIKAQDEIRSLNNELEQRVRERTSQLSAVNRELEAFSYSVSHDLRTPLRAIDGFSHALLEDYGDILSQEGRYYLERIRVASQRLGQLIDDLLKLSRLTRSEIQRMPTDLSDLAHSILEELRISQPKRHVQAVIQPKIIAEGDPRLLRVALENLLNNAWKFTSQTASAQIEFGTLDYEDERVYYIRDNGAGFDMTYADKLFGAFQRLHSTSEFEGTGIGLATVQRIIHRHGGRIWASSAVNEGATFYFTLPGDGRGSAHG
ncbi:MAG TPA: PAS domain-containing protein [Aggregatilinea sp.]|uniref:PAS domain-containing protein n=1 Tax=Aggregatilinea sp. TaxID=2806333 RepID=UPI002CFFDEA7|nr:PAS domain-containing protein [Aggregatilinea sp.]HML23168.1 PAS domain-containing protein [Aggregatilinea sp.]